MRFSIGDDKIYFVIGASMAAGRAFWIKNGESNKYTIQNKISVSLSKDTKVLRSKLRSE